MKLFLRRRIPVVSVLATLLLLLGSLSTCVAFTGKVARRDEAMQNTLHRKIDVMNARVHHNLKGRQPTSCHMMNQLDINAAMALMGSSYVGLQLDRMVPNSGIVGTLAISAVLSNIFSSVPTFHRLYDICWTHVLPASLVMLLLAYQADQSTSQESSTDLDTDSSTTSTILRMFIPFLWASFGSLLGCFTSFKCSEKFDWFALDNAKCAAACLSASYVGGSINYFATGRLIKAKTDLLGSLATADLFIMAFYFAFLSLSLDWKWLKSIFYVPNATTDDTSTLTPEKIEKNTMEVTPPKAIGATKKFLGLSLVMGFALCLVDMSRWVERVLERWVPGTASAVIATVAPIINSRINREKWWLPLRETVSKLGDFLFLCFFAAIGIGSDLRGVVEMGPACFCFAGIAISIHLAISLLGSSIGARFLKVELEDVWIASNAAIGGPATAAAFCSRLNSKSNLRDKALAGTVCGCIGYAVGTTIGSFMYRLVGG